MKQTAAAVKAELKKHANPAKAIFLKGFFKTGPGQYAEGDVMLGITVPVQRQIAKQFSALPIDEVEKLLESPTHEHRLTGFLILVQAYKTAPKTIERFYLSHLKSANNWDLVDLSAPNILGTHLVANPSERKVLYKLARSKNLWERRVAMVATYSLIRNGEFTDTVEIAKILLDDTHDLIHKAVGWMLREVGKKSDGTLRDFLDTHVSRMPRTALRYAIERMPEKDRKRYLAS